MATTDSNCIYTKQDGSTKGDANQNDNSLRWKRWTPKKYIRTVKKRGNGTNYAKSCVNSNEVVVQSAPCEKVHQVSRQKPASGWSACNPQSSNISNKEIYKNKSIVVTPNRAFAGSTPTNSYIIKL